MEGLGGLPPPDLTEQELEVVTTVFRNYETGLREATIYPKVRSSIGLGGFGLVDNYIPKLRAA